MAKPKILIVEDEIIIAEDLRRRLENLGYSVTAIATTGPKAIQAAEEGNPDLVLMDIVLKGEMDGIEAAGIIRRQSGNPVVYLTAYADETFLTRAKVTEPFGYLLKPFEDRELHATIEVALYKHRMEQELLESKRWFATTLRSIGDAVIATDREGNVRFMNPAAQALTGWQEEDAIGKPLEVVFNIFKGGAVATDQEPIKVTSKKEGEPRISDFFLLTREGKKIEVCGTILTKDEVKIPIEDSLSPIQDDKGIISGTVMAFRDISDRKQNEERLRKSEKKFKTLAELAPIGVYMTDEKGKCKYINKTWMEMTDLTMNEAKGDGWVRGLHPDDRGMLFSKWKKMVAAKGKWGVEYRFVNQTGKTTWVYGVANPIIDSNGNVTGYIGANLDISQQKQAIEEKEELEKRLGHAQKMEAIGTLAGGIAHDFNNILGAIIGYTEMALEDLPVESEIYSNIQEVLKAGNRATDLVKQILAFSRQSDREFKPIRIQFVIKEALKLLRSSIPTTIEIRQNIDPDCEAVLADPSQVHQIIMNLCTNAYHAMRKTGGVLGVSLQPVELTSEDLNDKIKLFPGPYVKLEICDCGHGMTRDILERVFDPYFTTKEKGEGTGLGLAMVHGIVRSFQGDVAVYSEPGKGSTFHVYLPVVKETKEVGPEKDPTPLPTGNERILLVDDDEMLAQMNKTMLERLGYQVTALISSLDTLKLFQEKPNDFDLVITDMTMPNMTGAELSRKILAIRPDIPIILCTGFSELINEDKAKEIGIRDYVMKPVIRKELTTAVRKVLDGS